MRVLLLDSCPFTNLGEQEILYGLKRIIVSKHPSSIFSMVTAYDQRDSGYSSDDVNLVNVAFSPIFSLPFRINSKIFSPFVFVILFFYSYFFRVNDAFISEYRRSDLLLFGHDSSYGFGGSQLDDPYLSQLLFPFLAFITRKPIIYAYGTIPKPPITHIFGRIKKFLL